MMIWDQFTQIYDSASLISDLGCSNWIVLMNNVYWFNVPLIGLKGCTKSGSGTNKASKDNSSFR